VHAGRGRRAHRRRRHDHHRGRVLSADEGAPEPPDHDAATPADATPEEAPFVTTPEPDTSDAPPRSKRRAVLIGVGLLVVVAAIAAGAVLLTADDGGGYGDDVEDTFLAACTAQGGDDVAPVCECLYAGIVDTIPYDRFEEVDDSFEAELADDPDAELRLPSDIDEIRVDCVDDEGVPITTTPPTREGDDESNAPDLTPPIPGDTGGDTPPEGEAPTTGVPTTAPATTA
jgi:hypothetical protein